MIDSPKIGDEAYTVPYIQHDSVYHGCQQPKPCEWRVINFDAAQVVLLARTGKIDSIKVLPREDVFDLAGVKQAIKAEVDRIHQLQESQQASAYSSR
jgi:hypothetical protein